MFCSCSPPFSTIITLFQPNERKKSYPFRPGRLSPTHRKEYSFERGEGNVTAILSYIPKYNDGTIANYRRFYADFVSLDESKLVNEYSIGLSVTLDFSEEDALAILNSVKIMDKDEADTLYATLLQQVETNEYFDPATIK